MSPQAEAPVKEKEQSSSSSSSTSSSSAEEVSDWENTFSDMEGCQWFLQDGHGRPALLHLVKSSDEPELIPWCRKTAFANAPIESGFGMRLASLVPTQPCPRCLKMMPEESAQYVRQWLVD